MLCMCRATVPWTTSSGQHTPTSLSQAVSAPDHKKIGWYARSWLQRTEVLITDLLLTICGLLAGLHDPRVAYWVRLLWHPCVCLHALPVFGK